MIHRPHPQDVPFSPNLPIYSAKVRSLKVESGVDPASIHENSAILPIIEVRSKTEIYSWFSTINALGPADAEGTEGTRESTVVSLHF